MTSLEGSGTFHVSEHWEASRSMGIDECTDLTIAVTADRMLNIHSYDLVLRAQMLDAAGLRERGL